MKSSHVLAICVVAALVLGSSSFTEAAEGTYDYTNGPNGPANWGNLPGAGTCKTGMMQSPMLITADNMVTSDSLDKKLRTMVPNGPIPANISNNGKTVEVAMKGSTLKINGVTYESAQFHLHHPSEHTILGYTFALELHLVHIEPATGRIAVIGWLFTLGEESPFLAQFFDELPSSGQANVPINPITFTLSSEGTYGRYMGSLTTPPCSENVTWTLMLWDFPTVSAQQLDQLFAVVPNPNARPTQAPNGRDLVINT